MPRDRECMVYARECLRLARMAEDPVIQARLTEIAHLWMAAAMEETLDAAPPRAARRNRPGPRRRGVVKGDFIAPLANTRRTTAC
jgi:hypothetical protein